MGARLTLKKKCTPKPVLEKIRFPKKRRALLKKKKDGASKKRSRVRRKAKKKRAPIKKRVKKKEKKRAPKKRVPKKLEKPVLKKARRKRAKKKVRKKKAFREAFANKGRFDDAVRKKVKASERHYKSKYEKLKKKKLALGKEIDSLAKKNKKLKGKVAILEEALIACYIAQAFDDEVVKTTIIAFM